MCVCVCVCLSVCLCVCVCTRSRACVYACMSLCVYACVYMCVCLENSKSWCHQTFLTHIKLIEANNEGALPEFLVMMRFPAD